MNIQNKKILIIEDDEAIADLEKDYLELAGFSVEVCNDGLKGINILNEQSFDLLVLDIMLPTIDGFGILKRLRDDLDMPVLMVSAKKDEIDKIRGLGLGADDYITKPFSPSELVARVKAHISKYERLKTRFSNATAIANTDILNIRGLEIQKDSMRVFANDKEVVLTQKEFELLLFLCNHPNRVFSREELFEKIWGLDSLGDAATVTVHIARIREKIESTPSNPQYIETVWGAGYRLKL